MHRPETKGLGGAEAEWGPQQMVSALGAWASRGIAANLNVYNHLRGLAGAATANGALAQAAAQRCARRRCGCRYDEDGFPASFTDAADPAHVPPPHRRPGRRKVLKGLQKEIGDPRDSRREDAFPPDGPPFKAALIYVD